MLSIITGGCAIFSIAGPSRIGLDCRDEDRPPREDGRLDVVLSVREIDAGRLMIG